MGEWVTLDTHYGPVRAWQATPEGKPRGGLVVIQEIFGANPHIRAVADDYAAKGYAVLAPSFFDLADSAPDGSEPPELPYDSDGVAAGLQMVDELGVEKALEIVRAAASRLAPAGKVGTVGYCWGGSIALLCALRLGLPSVSYYGARNVRPTARSCRRWPRSSTPPITPSTAASDMRMIQTAPTWRWNAPWTSLRSILDERVRTGFTPGHR